MVVRWLVAWLVGWLVGFFLLWAVFSSGRLRVRRVRANGRFIPSGGIGRHGRDRGRRIAGKAQAAVRLASGVPFPRLIHSHLAGAAGAAPWPWQAWPTRLAPSCFPSSRRFLSLFVWGVRAPVSAISFSSSHDPMGGCLSAVGQSQRGLGRHRPAAWRGHATCQPGGMPALLASWSTQPSVA